MKTLAIVMLAMGLMFTSPAVAQADPDTEMFERVERLTKVIGDQIFDMILELLVKGEQDINAVLKELERRYDIVPPNLDLEGEEI